jgi:hypothetical protein
MARCFFNLYSRRSGTSTATAELSSDTLIIATALAFGCPKHSPLQDSIHASATRSRDHAANRAFVLGSLENRERKLEDIKEGVC